MARNGFGRPGALSGVRFFESNATFIRFFNRLGTFLRFLESSAPFIHVFFTRLGTFLRFFDRNAPFICFFNRRAPNLQNTERNDAKLTPIRGEGPVRKPSFEDRPEPSSKVASEGSF